MRSYDPGKIQPRNFDAVNAQASARGSNARKAITEECCVDRDGVKIHRAIHGDGREAMMSPPPWVFVRSRCLKVHAPYFSERHRCIT